jgi:hypothetical protein
VSKESEFVHYIHFPHHRRHTHATHMRAMKLNAFDLSLEIFYAQKALIARFVDNGLRLAGLLATHLERYLLPFRCAPNRMRPAAYGWGAHVPAMLAPRSTCFRYETISHDDFSDRIVQLGDTQD